MQAMLTKHMLVIVVAILFATYRLLQLENERDRRQANIQQDFDTVVDLLQTHLDTKYRVLRVVPSPDSVITLHAIVINSGSAIPHVEAEVVVDQQHVLHQRKQDQRKRARHALPCVRFQVYDVDTMTPIAEMLQQRNLIAPYKRSYSPT
uniref:Uncharacterized protein n=1 Tax=Peronospora matthiolae TaxID=2874970 RepID=A0AAV1T315_9STRA